MNCPRQACLGRTSLLVTSQKRGLSAAPGGLLPNRLTADDDRRAARGIIRAAPLSGRVLDARLTQRTGHLGGLRRGAGSSTRSGRTKGRARDFFFTRPPLAPLFTP